MQYLIRYMCSIGERLAIANKTDEFDNMMINDIENQLANMIHDDVKILTIKRIKN